MRSSRSVEIDLLRVLAIGMMMTYHAAYDLQIFYDWDLDVFGGAWWVMERTCASLFLLLVGISFVLSWQRTPEQKKYLKRGLKVFGYGLVVSIVTYVMDPETFVRFGILHCIGISLMLLPSLVGLRWWNAVIGIVFVIFGLLIRDVIAPTSLLLPLGFMPSNFLSVDYFPMLPWFGVVLIGLCIGQVYAKYQHSLTFLNPQMTFAKALAAVSAQSLLIYMVHQPIILGVLKIVSLQYITRSAEPLAASPDRCSIA